MKTPRNVDDLAARLTDAASKPVPLPVVAAPPLPTAANEPGERPAAPPQAPRERPAKAAKPAVIDTKAITLRISQALLKHYTLAAAERTKREGRVISAQQVMLERLAGEP